MSSKPTIRDVAREAGVGVGTVSRALSGAPHVSAASRRRVLEAVERLGFHPNHTARGLARGRTQTLGVLVPFFTKHYFLEILRGVQQAASAHDYSLIVYNAERPEQAVAHLQFLAKTRRVDGLVVIAISGQLVQRAYPAGSPLPIVCVDTQIAGAVSIAVKHEKGMYLAVRHLAGLGRCRIALIDRPQDPVSGSVTAARRRGYRRACREAGLPAPDPYTLVAEYSQEGGYEAAGRLLALPDRPDALACASDLQALGALRAVEEAGLRVPADVAVTGYHDVELAQYVGLTTVRVPAFQMGDAAAGLVVDISAGRPPEGRPGPFEPELVVRRTCGACLTAGSG